MQNFTLLGWTLFMVGCSGLFVELAAQSSTYQQQLDDHREQYVLHLVEGPRAPLDSNQLSGIRFFPVDSTYRVQATFTRTVEAEPFDLATYSGITKPYVQYGWIDFRLGDDSLRLAVYQSLRLQKNPLYRDYLFLPFKDATCGESTYGGGRYLDLKITDVQQGQVTIDFNKTYNPYCAYSDGYNCPIPPAPNHLSIPIEAGEKMYQKEKNE